MRAVTTLRRGILLWLFVYLSFDAAVGSCGQSWRERLVGFIGAFAFTGGPLLLALPVLYHPMLGRTYQRFEGRATRWIAVPGIGGFIGLVLGLLPGALLGGGIQGIVTGASGAMANLWRSIDRRLSWPFMALYAIHGALLGGWYARRRGWTG